MAEAFDDIGLEFSFSKTGYDDIAVTFEYNAMEFLDINLAFEFLAANYYNYQNISLLFQVSLGIDYSDISFHFSVIKQPQNFMSYIFQKLYCVTTELEPVHDDVQLQNWNVKPNQTWYVANYFGLICLYETFDDLDNDTNCVATGEVNFETLEVVLHYLDEYGEEDEEMDYYYTDYPVHLTISYAGNARKFKVKPLTDMAEIRHAIYNNSNITISRGEAELNLHTYAIKGREVVLGTHLPELECGDSVNLTSTRRNKTAEKSQVLSQTIVGEVGDNGETSLITTINVANYTELYR